MVLKVKLIGDYSMGIGSSVFRKPVTKKYKSCSNYKDRLRKCTNDVRLLTDYRETIPDSLKKHVLTDYDFRSQNISPNTPTNSLDDRFTDSSRRAGGTRRHRRKSSMR
jgi:hypothetical protein